MTSPDPTPKPKESWPLFVVAGLGFVPVAGILLGAIGASWGLVSSRPKAMLAALIGALGAMANIGFLVFMSFSMIGKEGGMGVARQHIAERDLLALVMALEKYHDKEHGYPAQLDDLPGHTGILKKVGLMDQSAGPLRAQREYTYRPSADGSSYDLFAVGPDGAVGTADDIRPVVPDSIKSHSGYRPAAAGAPK